MEAVVIDIIKCAGEGENVYVAKQETQKNKCCVSLCIKLVGGCIRNLVNNRLELEMARTANKSRGGRQTKCPTFYRSTGIQSQPVISQVKANHPQSRSDEPRSHSASPNFVGEAENDLRKENVDLVT